MSESGAPNPAKPIPTDKVPYWHLLPFTVFIVMNIAMIVLFEDRLMRVSSNLTVLHIVVLGLATFRIADIIANEQVTKVVRAPFINVKEGNSEDGEEEEVPKRHGFKSTMGSLLYCPSCIGVWVAAFMTYGLILIPTATWVIASIFLLSALERICTIGLTALGK